MADFYFYDYMFKDVPQQKDMFSEQANDFPADTNVLGRILVGKKKLPFVRTNDSGETVSFINDLTTRDGVSIIRLSKDKTIKVVDSKFEQYTIDSHPYVNIVIDNREGRQIIGIERRNVFGKSDLGTRNVAALLAESINRGLVEYGKAVELTPVTTTNEIWSVVRNRVFENDDKVTSISFSFGGTAGDDTDKSSILKDYILPLQQLMSAQKINTELTYEDGGSETMNKIHHDLVNLSLVLKKEQNYSLDIRFSKWGVYRAGSTLWAHFPVNGNAIQDFRTGTRSITSEGQLFELEEIMDNIKKQMTDNETWK